MQMPFDQAVEFGVPGGGFDEIFPAFQVVCLLFGGDEAPAVEAAVLHHDG